MNRTQKIAELRAGRRAWRQQRSAARVRYLDEMGKYGEMELGSVKAGDLVKFEGEFIKQGDEEEEGGTSSETVAAGEIGEVLDVLADVPGLLVDAPCMCQRGGTSTLGDRELIVDPQQVVVLVDGRDERTGPGRIAASRLAVWYPLIELAVSATRELDLFPGKTEFTEENPRHVSWALQTMADGIRETLPEHEVDYEDEDEDLADLADGMAALVDGISRGSENWMQDLAHLKGAADYVEFNHVYPGTQLIMLNPTGYAELGATSEEGFQQQYVQEQAAEYPPWNPADEGTPDPELEQQREEEQTGEPGPAPEVEYYDPETEEEIQRTFKEWGWPESPLGEGLPEPEEMPTAPEPEPPEPVGVPDRPAAEHPTKFDVPIGELNEDPAGSPHEWAQTDVGMADIPGGEPEPRAPIQVYRGFSGGQGSSKVWAEPGMQVRHKRKRQEGIVEGVMSGDIIAVKLLHAKPGQPDVDQWDTGEVILSKAETGPATGLTSEELKRWRNDRWLYNERLRQEEERSRGLLPGAGRGPGERQGAARGWAAPWGPMSRVTVVTAESLTLT